MLLNYRSFVSAALLALIGTCLFVAGPAAAFVDKDCPDFASQKAAQIFFLNQGGPKFDPHRLDSDSDGIACETNPPPYYYGTTLPNEPPPAPVVVKSSLTLKALTPRRIAGETTRLRAQVAPQGIRTVVLQRQRAGGGWTRVTIARSSAKGRVVFRPRTPASTTTYRAVVLRKKVKGKVLSAARSQHARVVTQRQAVSFATSRTVVQGNRLVATATATPARPGRIVALQRYSNRGWVVLATRKASASGVARFPIPTARPGTVTYRAVATRFHGARAAVSPRRAVTVTSPTPVDVTPPPVPTGISATAGDGQVALDWSDVAAADLAGYRVYQSTAGGPWILVGSTSASDIVVTGLSNGTEYRFGVASLDTRGNESARSAEVAATPVVPDTEPPGVPSGLVATPGDGIVDLVWDVVGDGDLAGYRVYYRTAPDGVWTQLPDLLWNSTTVSGLNNGTSYLFAVTAVDTSGNESAPSAEVEATPAAP